MVWWRTKRKDGVKVASGRHREQGTLKSLKMVRDPELESHSNPKQCPVRHLKHRPIIIILVSPAGVP